ncbi:MAG: MFS transporter [Thiomonas sp.]
MSNPSQTPTYLPSYPPLRLALAMWALAAAAYMAGFFLRVTPGVLNVPLMRDFHLNAAQLGNLASFYFYFYAASQIPTGIANDRWGPKALIVFGTLLTGVGTLLFAAAPNYPLALAARGLIGLGHGVAWVSLLEISARWFAPRVFGTMSGLSLGAGTLGAVLAQAPLLAMSHWWGWRWTLAGVGVICVLLGLLAWGTIRNSPHQRGYRDYLPPRPPTSAREVLRGLRAVWGWRNTALLFVAPSGVCGAFLTFTTLWGAPFLEQHRGMSGSQASWMIAAMLVGFSAGGIAWGRLSDRLRRRKLPYVTGAMFALLGFAQLSLWPQAPGWVLWTVQLLSAVGSGAMVVGFAWAKESVPASLAGTATGVHNTGVMIGALVQLPLLGWVLDALWTGRAEAGVRLYDLHAFQAAFGVLMAWLVVSLVCVLLASESHARPLEAARPQPRLRAEA